MRILFKRRLAFGTRKGSTLKVTHLIHRHLIFRNKFFLGDRAERRRGFAEIDAMRRKGLRFTLAVLKKVVRMRRERPRDIGKRRKLASSGLNFTRVFSATIGAKIGLCIFDFQLEIAVFAVWKLLGYLDVRFWCDRSCCHSQPSFALLF